MAFALRMAKLTKDPRTGNWKSRKAIPKDCRALFGKREDMPVWPAQLTEWSWRCPTSGVGRSG
jgi:hypothetical protein